MKFPTEASISKVFGYLPITRGLMGRGHCQERKVWNHVIFGCMNEDPKPLIVIPRVTVSWLPWEKCERMNGERCHQHSRRRDLEHTHPDPEVLQ